MSARMGQGRAGIALAWASAALLAAALLLEARSRSDLEEHVERLVADGGRLALEVDELASARDDALRAAAREAARRERAELDRAATADALLAARRDAYAHGVRAARLALELGDLAAVGGILDGLAPDLRGFEHGHLRARAARVTRGHRGHESLVTTLAASGDGTLVASAGYDDAVLLRDPLTGSGEGLLPLEHAVLALALDAAAARLAVSVDDDRVALFALPLGPDGDAPPRELLVGERVWALDLDAAGRRLALGTDGGRLSVHDTEDLAPIDAIEVPAGVQALAFTPDGALVAAGDEDGVLHLWRVGAAAGELRSLRAHDAWIAALAVSPDGALVATCAGDGEAALWRIADGERIGTLAEPGGVLALDFGVDGAHLVVGTGAGAVSLRDARGGDGDPAELGRITVGARVERVAACSGGRVAFLAEDERVHVWNPAPAPPRHVLAVEGGAVHDARLSADGLCVVGSADGAVRVYDVGTEAADVPEAEPLQPLHRFDDHAQTVRSVAFAPAGDVLASGARDGTLVVRRGTGFAERVELPARPAPVEELAFGRDGAVLAVLTADGAVVHLDVVTGAERAALPGPATGIFAAALGPEGSLSAFAAAGGTLRIFEPETGDRRAALRLPDLGRTLRMAVAPGGRALALAVSGASTRLIAVPSDRGDRGDHGDPVDPVLARLPLPRGGFVDGLAFSPDGARLAVGASDGVVRVVDARNGFELVALRTGLGGVRCLAFSPDGVRLAVGGADGRAEVWW